MTDFQEFLFE